MRHHILVASDTDFDRLIAEIYVDDVLVAILSQEDGPDAIDIGFVDDLSGAQPSVRLRYEAFLAILEEARRRLLGRD